MSRRKKLTEIRVFSSVAAWRRFQEFVFPKLFVPKAEEKACCLCKFCESQQIFLTRFALQFSFVGRQRKRVETQSCVKANGAKTKNLGFNSRVLIEVA